MSSYSTTQGDFVFLLLGLLPIIMWLSMLAFSVAVYVLRSLGLYKMASNTAAPNPWMAFIPIAHEYLAAKMADRGNAARGKSTKYGQWMLISGVVMMTMAVYILVQFVLAVFGEVLHRWIPIDLIITLSMLMIFLYYMLFMLICLAVKVLLVVSHYYLYRDFDPQNAVLYTAITVFGLDVVCKLLIKDNVPVSIAGMHQFRQPKYRA